MPYLDSSRAADRDWTWWPHRMAQPPRTGVVVIKTGALTFYSSEDPTCTGRTYTAGQAFIDSGQGHIHIARNLSASENVELWATYFDVPPGGAFRVDAGDPGTCGF